MTQSASTVCDPAPPEQAMRTPDLAGATQLQPRHVDEKTTETEAGTETRPPPPAVAPQPLPASGPDQTASQEHAPDNHTSEDNVGVTQADVLIIRTLESTWIGPVDWQGLPHGIGTMFLHLRDGQTSARYGRHIHGCTEAAHDAACLALSSGAGPDDTFESKA